MGQREYERQWQSIMENNMFSEMATITVGETSYKVSGIFISGSYAEESTAAYAPKRLTGKDFFQLSSYSISGIKEPWNALRGASIEVSDRGKFRVFDISGRRGGMYTLELQEVEE